MGRYLTYFVADVHLGLEVNDPADRERRFTGFLRSLPKEETEALYLLGDIWDFWYEYRDVVPKGYIGVLAALTDLMEAGVKVYFFQGNHDVWTYHYFEELGMKRLVQPAYVEIAGTRFCLGHGDGLGPVPAGYRFLRGIFHNRVLQFLFSMLHPWLAFRFGKGWSVDTLENCRKLFSLYSKSASVLRKSDIPQKSDTMFRIFEESEQALPNFALTWSHYLILMRIKNDDGTYRHFYDVLTDLSKVYNS